MREMDLKCLATRALEALGVNVETPDAATIMRHSIAQACLELEAVEQTLERGPGDTGTLVYIVMGIRQRLELAAQSSEMLASLVAVETGATDGAPGQSGGANV